MLTGPSRVLPVPDSDHRRSATVVVMLSGCQRRGCRTAGVTACLPGAAMDPAGRARWQSPGRPQRRRQAPTPRPARRDRSRRNRRGCPSSRACSPGRIRASSQPDPARGMIRIRQPDSGNPGTSAWETGGKLKGLRRVRVNPAGIWMTWRPAAPGPSLTAPSVGRGRGSRPDFSVIVSSGSWQTAPISAVCPALSPRIFGRGCRCRQPARPASRRARLGVLRPGDRRGDRGGSGCRLRDGIGQTCAGRPLPATSWSLRRSRAGCRCPRAGR
jgi:hypothetical protein